MSKTVHGGLIDTIGVITILLSIYFFYVSVRDTAIFKDLWSFVDAVGKNTLVQVIAGTIAAAYAGSKGSQAVVEKTKKREIYLREIRNVNAAINASHAVCAAALSIKIQRINNFKSNFELEMKKVTNGLDKAARGEKVLLDTAIDLANLAHIELPVPPVQKWVDGISASGKISALVSVLFRSSVAFSEAIDRRNAIIDDLRNQPKMPVHMEVKFLLGLQQQDGSIDTRYKDLMNWMIRSCDDCIYFSKRLSEESHVYGSGLVAQINDDTIKIIRPDYSDAKENIPDPKEYEAIETAFAGEPPPIPVI